MDRLHIFLVALFGAVSCNHDSVSGSVLDVTVRPGDNITLHCDCKLSTGIYIVWYRDCSHENQPSLVLEVKRGPTKLITDFNHLLKISPHFQFVRNYSSNSYDLLIMNITESNEGLYYCGTEEPKVVDETCITSRSVYRYGNIKTRIIFNSSPCPDSSGCISDHVPVVSWLVVFSPALTILSAFISLILVYHFCQKTDKESQILQKGSDTEGQTRWDQNEEDVCFTRVVFWTKDGQTHQQTR